MQRTAWGLASLGISQSALSLLARRYQGALAAPSGRKIALLIGINQYPESVCDCPPFRGMALQGAVTDVALQRELLVHRFGFQPSDVLTLTDQQATRENIETAFMSHLVGQARPGDVAVFHFSGFGSHVRLTNAAGEQSRVRNSFVPIDGALPTPSAPTVNDMMESTLVLMLRSLQTRQVTAVLDLSHAEPGTTILGGIRIRSRPSVPSGDLNKGEAEFQQQLAAQLGLGRKERQTYDQAPGFILAATETNRLAAEGSWNGFSAGLFTYALTQQLWNTTPAASIYIDMSQAAGRVEQIVGPLQQPILIAGTKSSLTQTSMSSYPTTPARPSADGSVSAVDEAGQASLWIGGLPATVVANYAAGSVMGVVAPANAKVSGAALESEALTLLQVKSKEGLTTKAKVLGGKIPKTLQAGQLVQECLRVIPKNTALIVALDFSLERIERVDAISALAAIPRISSVVAGEQPADYLFGKAMSPVQTTALSFDASSGKVAFQDGSSNADRVYGLFSLGRTAIPSTVLNTEEAVKTAVNRVAPQLRSLLAAKLMRLTENQASSRLGVRATLEIVAPDERILMQHTAQRSPWPQPESRLATLLMGRASVPTIESGSKIQYRLQNFSDRPVYCVLLGVDSDGNAIALYPATQRSKAIEQDASLIEPGDTITMPPPGASTEWRIDSPPGLAETHVVFSAMPLTKTAAALGESVRPTGNTRQVSPLSDPLTIAQAILSDLHRASADARVEGLELSGDVYALQVDRWATLSFYYRVDEAIA